MDGARPHKPWPTHLIPALLIGFSLATYGRATLEQLRQGWHPSRGLTDTLILAMLMCLVLGLRLPRLMGGFAREASGDRERIRDADRGVVPDPRRGDHLRMLGSGCLLTTGVTMMLLRPMARGLAGWYADALVAYHWTPLTLRLLELVLMLAYVAVPVISLGVALNCAQRLTLQHSHRVVTSSAAVSLGLSVGLLIVPLWLDVRGFSVTLLTALCLMCAAVLELRPGPKRDACVRRTEDVPMLEEHGRRTLLVLLCAVGALLMGQLLVWQELEPVLGLWRCSACMVAALAMGLFAGTAPGDRWIPSCQQLAALALGVALAIACVVLLGPLTTRLYQLPALLRLGLGFLIVAPSFGIGVMIAALTEAIAERGARPSRTVVTTSVWLACGMGIGVWPALGGGLAQFRPYVWLVLMSLGWLTIASGFILLQPRRGLQHCRVQIGLTLGMLAAFVIAFPTVRPAWKRCARDLSPGAMGQLRAVEGLVEAEHLVEKVLAGTAGPPPVRDAEVEGAAALDQLWRDLAVRREPCAAVVLTFTTDGPGRRQNAAQKSQPVQPMIEALVSMIRSRLRPDGAFIVHFDGNSEAGGSTDDWLDSIARSFNGSTWSTDASGLRQARRTLLATCSSVAGLASADTP